MLDVSNIKPVTMTAPLCMATYQSDIVIYLLRRPPTIYINVLKFSAVVTD